MKIHWIDAKDSTVWVKKVGPGVVRECIDFTSGIFCANVGHGNEHVMKAIKSVSYLHSYHHRTNLYDEYKKRLLSWIPGDYHDVAFFSDGTTAVEAAIRILKKTCAKKIYGFSGCFHGRSWGPENVITRMFPHEISHMDLDLQWNAFVVEGYRGFDAKFWDKEAIQDLLSQTVVCFDEIQSGFGRTGEKFAFEHYDIMPDMVAIGKGMGSGFPLSGVVTNMTLDHDNLSCTHGGNPMAMAAGIATLDEFDRLCLVGEAKVKGKMMHYALNKLEIPVTGRGMVAALHFSSPSAATSFCECCLDEGLLLVETGKNTVKIGPPLTISDSELMEGIKIIREVLDEN